MKGLVLMFDLITIIPRTRVLYIAIRNNTDYQNQCCWSYMTKNMKY